MNLILFWLYITCVLVLFVFISIVIMHIGEFRQYSRYINPVLRIYIISIVVIAVIWSYQVLTNQTPTDISLDSSQKVKLEF